MYLYYNMHPSMHPPRMHLSQTPGLTRKKKSRITNGNAPSCPSNWGSGSPRPRTQARAS